MTRGYQLDFSAKMPSVYDARARELKAQTMIAVLSDFYKNSSQLSNLTLLDIGASTGIIDNYLADYFKQVVGIDIDQKALSHAQNTYHRNNLVFNLGDAMALQYEDSSFDVVICSHVYEHVPDAPRMMAEISRVLKPSGVCFFAAGNRLNMMEPHYRLPLLSVIPKPMAHIYLMLCRKGNHYYEEHLWYWGLKRLINSFTCYDYTLKMLNAPDVYKIEYMLPPGSIKSSLAKIIMRFFKWAVPTYIWLLQKPEFEQNAISARNSNS